MLGNSVRILAAGLAVAIASVLFTGCSSISNPSSPDDIYARTFDGAASDLESVKVEYNADLADLQALLDRASVFESQIRDLEPVDSYDHAAVDAYNDLVNSYNAVADDYRFAARAFNHKYRSYADGADGVVPTSPDAITLPDPIP